jgi:hypothetical protein
MITFQLIAIVQQLVERCRRLFGSSGLLEANRLTRGCRGVPALTLGGGASESIDAAAATRLRLSPTA